MSIPGDFSSEAYEAHLARDVEQHMKLTQQTASTESTDTAAAAAAGDSDATAAASSASASASSDSAAASASSDSSSASDAANSASGAGAASTPLTIEEVVEKDAAKALEAKQRGNAFFARQQYAQAIDEYTLAISLQPDGESATSEQREALAVFYSNRAACFLMQSEYEKTIADCTASLTLNPTNNAKPLSRRAKAYEATQAYAEAIDDLKALQQLDPSDRDVQTALARVEAAQSKKNEEMKAEMMGKLKDFGNTILGKFGLSLDNFKATQDPNTGSYNISFGK